MALFPLKDLLDGTRKLSVQLTGSSMEQLAVGANEILTAGSELVLYKLSNETRFKSIVFVLRGWSSLNNATIKLQYYTSQNRLDDGIYFVNEVTQSDSIGGGGVRLVIYDNVKTPYMRFSVINNGTVDGQIASWGIYGIR